MYATERQQFIERLISADGRVTVVALAEQFGVTTETVRRDLAHLEQTGVLRRVHGGAVSRTRVSTAELSLATRSLAQGEAKQAIARAAARLTTRRGEESVYLDAGSTTAAVASALLEGSAPGGSLDIVTHSMTIAHRLAGHPGVSLTAIGGRVRGLTAAAVGADTVAAVERLRPDLAFVGVNGLSAGFGLSTPDPEEAAVKSAIVAAARRVVIVADAEKFEDEYLVSFARWSDVDTLVCDTAPTGDLAAAIAAHDVEVIVA